MKSYSWHGASPQVSWIPSDQKGVEHFEHVWRVNPCFRNSSTSYSLSGIFGLRTNGPRLKVLGWPSASQSAFGRSRSATAALTPPHPPACVARLHATARADS